MAKIRLVSIDKVVSQRDWLRHVLGDSVAEEETEEAWPAPRPDTLYCIDTDWHPLARIPENFLNAVRVTPRVGLFHSDEWLIQDYSIYTLFSYVIRVHYAPGIKGPGILTLPLGWPNGGQGEGIGLPASQRPISWFFAGSLVSSRHEMVKAFKTVEHGECMPFNVDFHKKPLAPEEFRDKLRHSAIIPAGMGNVVAETWRFYEALEAGSIPIVEKRLTLDYYRRLFGPHPVPTFANWDAAARFVRDLLRNERRLDGLQREIFEWWSGYRQSTRQQAREFLLEATADELRPALGQWRFPTGWRRVVWQYTQLIRHQSAPALARRIRKAVKRGSLRRDMGYLDGKRR